MIIVGWIEEYASLNYLKAQSGHSMALVHSMIISAKFFCDVRQKTYQASIGYMS